MIRVSLKSRGDSGHVSLIKEKKVPETCLIKMFQAHFYGTVYE